MLLFTYDSQAKAAMVRVSEMSPVEQREVFPGVVVDIDINGQLCAVEVLE